MRRPISAPDVPELLILTISAQTGSQYHWIHDCKILILTNLHLLIYSPGNFTLYLKSIVYKQQNVLLAEDIFAMGYVGGDDCNFFKETDDYRSFMTTYVPNRSLFACMVPYGNRDYDNPMDITGQLPNDTSPSASDGRPQYETAQFYKSYWNFDNSSYVDGSAPHYHATAGRANTVCYQGHQSMYSIQDRTFNLVIKNTGHWSDRVYPGCGKVRNGFSKALEPVQYNNIFGGGGTSAYTSLGY